MRASDIVARLRRSTVATLAAATFAAAAMAAKPPPVPQLPSLEEMMKARQQSTGKSPQTERVAEGGVRVVFQTGHAGAVNSVAMSADGRYLLSASWDETAKLWDVASGQEMRTITGIGMGGGHVRFVKDAERFVVGSLEGWRLMDLNTGRTLREIGAQVAASGSGVAVSANGRYAAYADVNAETARRAWSVKHVARINVLDLAQDVVVATFDLDGSATVTALSDDASLLVLRRISSDRLLGGELEWNVELWEVARKKSRLTLPNAGEGASATVEHLSQALSPDGRLLATSAYGRVRVYDTTSGQRLLDLPTGNPMSMGSLTFSADGSLLVNSEMTTGPTAQGVRVWRLPGGEPVTSVLGSAAGFSADGRTLIVGRQSGGTPVLLDLQTGKETAVAGGSSAVVDLALIGTGGSVAAAYELGGVRHWDLGTGQLLRAFDCPGGYGTNSVSADRDGKWLAAACNDGGIYLWHLASGELAATVSAPPEVRIGNLAFVRFMAGGQRIVHVINEELVVWDVATRVELRRMTLPRSASLLETMSGAAVDDLEGLPEETRAAMQEMQAGAGDVSHAAQALALHPDGRHAAVAKDHGVLFIDLEAAQVVRRFPDRAAESTALQAAQSAAVPMQMEALQKMFGGRGLSRKQRKQLEEAMRQGASQLPARGAVMPAPDIGDLIDSTDFFQSIAFSGDGQTLFAQGMRGLRGWNVANGTPVGSARRPGAGGFDALADPMKMIEDLDLTIGGVMSQGIAVSMDGRYTARAHGNLMKLRELATGQDIASLAGHTSDVTSVAYSPDGRLLLSGGRDGTLRVWSAPGGNELVQLIALGASDYVAVTPDQYYRISRRGISGVAFRVQDRLYPFEQFDLRFNRPDIVLERLGAASPEVVQNFRSAYERRLKKMGLGAHALGGDLHLPEVTLVGAAPPPSTGAASLTLRVRATDTQYALSRLNVFVNDVPLLGSAGLPVPGEAAREFEQAIEVPLVPGRNKVQFSVLNEQGAESLRQTLYTTSTASAPAPDIYLVAVGVSRYRHSEYNLRFAAKDAEDLAATYRGLAANGSGAAYGQVHVLDLTNEKATREEIRRARGWLEQARVNDLVVVFAAGHGMTDARQDYYFGTHDIDPLRPETRGLPYEDFESLLDGISALKKVLLIDTCFSGEIDKEDTAIVAQTQVSGAGTVSMRAFKATRGVAVVTDEAVAAVEAATGAMLGTEALRFQQDLFADLRRGTGAVVISSASGNEYALEGEQWSNGVFTYALLNGLRNARADTNRDNTITVSELQGFVIDEVRRLTAGGQNPTVRRENLEYDFAVF